VVTADPQGASDQGGHAGGGVGVVELGDQEAWDMVTSSSTPRPPMMIPANSSPREGGPDHRGGRLGPGPMGEVQREEHDGHGPDHRDQDRAVAAEDRRDDEADDDQERQPKANQGADPLPAAEGDHRPYEQSGQDQHRAAPFQVLDAFVVCRDPQDRSEQPYARPGGSSTPLSGDQGMVTRRVICPLLSQ
jgi:hypothetical protein